MIPHDKPRICTTCRVPHVENCPDCFGWGRYMNGVVVTASEACDGTPAIERWGAVIACSTCGSDIRGAISSTQDGS